MKESVYKNALIPTSGRKLLAGLLDFILTLAFSLLLFGIVDSIANSFSSYQSIKNEITSSQTNLYQIIYDSKLSKASSTSSFLTEDQVFDDYVYGIVIASSDKDLKDVHPYSDYEEKNKDNDGIYYFYNTYKKEHQDDFIDCYSEKEGETYDFRYKKYSYDEYLSTFFPNSKDYFINNGDDYPILSVENAEYLRNYLANSYTKGEHIYNNLKTDYINAYNNALYKELASSKSYVENLNNFNNGKDTVLKIRGSILLCSYIVSTGLTYLMFPLIFKEGRTVGLKVFSLVYTDQKGNKPSYLLVTFRSLVLLLENSGMLSIAVFLLFSSQGMYLLTFTLWGFINILYLTIISIVLMIISIGFILFRKKTRQSLSETISMLIAKDTRDFKLDNLNKPNENEVKEEEIQPMLTKDLLAEKEKKEEEDGRKEN